MARSYAAVGSITNAASATLPAATIIGATSIRTKLFAFDLSSESAPADASAKFTFQRCTTTGTPGSSVTPQALDPGDPAAATTCGLATFSVGPTLTANAFLWLAIVYQRAAYHFQCAPGKELVVPATASNGLALMTPVLNSGPFTSDLSFHFEE